VLQFQLRAPARNFLGVRCRDCGDDIGTIVEFFSRLRQLIPPGLPALEPKVVYDIGAHIGIASLFLATHFPSARFYGFEPLPSNYNVCRLNYEGLPGSRAFPWAISSSSGRRDFRFGEGDLRGGCLAGSTPPLSTSLCDRVQVEVRSVHELVTAEKLDPPEFLKIDVEGAEFEVLTGLGAGERSVRRIWLETHGPEVRAHCIEWLGAHGFVIHSLGEDRPGCGLVWGDRVPE
jgi:FkbM family methyltransferase